MIRFVRPPKLSIWCYLIGFSAVFFAFACYYFQWSFLGTIKQQQLVIAGALVVTLGSIINWYVQFFQHSKNRK